jgi:hypothetical protein
MLESLIQSLPEERACLLRQELNLLSKTVERVFPDAEDREWANTVDLVRNDQQSRSNHPLGHQGEAS